MFLFIFLFVFVVVFVSILPAGALSPTPASKLLKSQINLVSAKTMSSSYQNLY
jgi:hypothetical protein